jgi:hypothetical protein
VALFEVLVPMMRVIEWVLPSPVGLSVVAVSEKYKNGRSYLFNLF